MCTDVLTELLQRLPIRVGAMVQKGMGGLSGGGVTSGMGKGKESSGAGGGGTARARTLGHSTDLAASCEDTALCCCNLLFEVIIENFKDLNNQDHFYSIWMSFIDALATNCNTASKQLPLVEETTEMLAALLRLLHPLPSSGSSSGSDGCSGGDRKKTTGTFDLTGPSKFVDRGAAALSGNADTITPSIQAGSLLRTFLSFAIPGKGLGVACKQHHLQGRNGSHYRTQHRATSYHNVPHHTTLHHRTPHHTTLHNTTPHYRARSYILQNIRLEKLTLSRPHPVLSKPQGRLQLLFLLRPLLQLPLVLVLTPMGLAVVAVVAVVLVAQEGRKVQWRE